MYLSIDRWKERLIESRFSVRRKEQLVVVIYRTKNNGLAFISFSNGNDFAKNTIPHINNVITVSVLSFFFLFSVAVNNQIVKLFTGDLLIIISYVKIHVRLSFFSTLFAIKIPGGAAAEPQIMSKTSATLENVA